MQQWIPPRLNHAAHGADEKFPALRPYIARPVRLIAAQIPGKDIAFCSELAFHGGTRVSHEGFANERDLFRLHEAGLLDLYRQNEQPFMIVRMDLSAAARKLVEGNAAARGDARPSAAGAAGADDSRRQVFEVARGMISVAAKSEFAAWRAAGQIGGADALEQRVLARILSLGTPYR
jgi:hypothetical protein